MIALGHLLLNKVSCRVAYIKVRVGLIDGGTGGTFDAAKNDLAAGVNFSTTISVDIKVM